MISFSLYSLCMNNKNEFKNTFSDILQAEKEKNSKLTTEIVEGLEKMEIKITPRTIQLYKKGTLVPEYNLAKKILKILKVSMSENELLTLLNKSKESRDSSKGQYIRKIIDPDSVKSDSTCLRKRIAIKADSFTFLEGSDLSPDYAIDLIESRVKELYGDDKYAFNRYIKDLIDKDMRGE